MKIKQELSEIENYKKLKKINPEFESFYNKQITELQNSVYNSIEEIIRKNEMLEVIDLSEDELNQITDIYMLINNY